MSKLKLKHKLFITMGVLLGVGVAASVGLAFVLKEKPKNKNYETSTELLNKLSLIDRWNEDEIFAGYISHEKNELMYSKRLIEEKLDKKLNTEASDREDLTHLNNLIADVQKVVKEAIYLQNGFLVSNIKFDYLETSEKKQFQTLIDEYEMLYASTEVAIIESLKLANKQVEFKDLILNSRAERYKQIRAKFEELLAKVQLYTPIKYLELEINKQLEKHVYDWHILSDVMEMNKVLSNIEETVKQYEDQEINRTLDIISLVNDCLNYLSQEPSVIELNVYEKLQVANEYIENRNIVEVSNQYNVLNDLLAQINYAIEADSPIRTEILNTLDQKINQYSTNKNTDFTDNDLLTQMEETINTAKEERVNNFQNIIQMIIQIKTLDSTWEKLYNLQTSRNTTS
ncbi:Uncharacterised protein [Metamycoplasma cloacale]|uniref:Uncharacterized protein n=1 Tax=Metamycoplasma cloacale TaxID=92401 RepID=A0A2Z4LLH9_9BACT|nr:hypothetical protein [Metamycoplasma cloacale]AWX42556.1 hypothetical protein DK849_00435 [Metamycoplasma cloacale]VEU79758.1 Uncharacterised protein [Metamycoplasma cloacale]